MARVERPKKPEETKIRKQIIDIDRKNKSSITGKSHGTDTGAANKYVQMGLNDAKIGTKSGTAKRASQLKKTSGTNAMKDYAYGTTKKASRVDKADKLASMGVVKPKAKAAIAEQKRQSLEEHKAKMAKGTASVAKKTTAKKKSTATKKASTKKK